MLLHTQVLTFNADELTILDLQAKWSLKCLAIVLSRQVQTELKKEVESEF